jgi:SHS2 domain-containing protein
MDDNCFEEIEHTADWAIHVRAKDFGGLLLNAALGMLNTMGLSTDVVLEDELELTVDGIDREDLLVRWLEELLYILERDGVGIGAMQLELSNDTHLIAKVKVAPSMVAEKEIKAVTYHGLSILETEDGLEATIVFDV